MQVLRFLIYPRFEPSINSLYININIINLSWINIIIINNLLYINIK
jgi:hypothetical protein